MLSFSHVYIIDCVNSRVGISVVMELVLEVWNGGGFKLVLDRWLKTNHYLTKVFVEPLNLDKFCLLKCFLLNV